MNFLDSLGAGMVRSIGGGNLMDRMARFTGQMRTGGQLAPPEIPELQQQRPMSDYSVDIAEATPAQREQERQARIRAGWENTPSYTRREIMAQQTRDGIDGRQGASAGRRGDLEAIARANGYPSYEAMINFQRQRSKPRTQQTVAGRGGGSAEDPRQSGNAMGWHPATVFGWLRDKLAGANEQGK